MLHSVMSYYAAHPIEAEAHPIEAEAIEESEELEESEDDE